MAKLININGQKKGKKTPYADSDSVGNLCKYVLGEDEKHSKNEILEIGAYGVDDHGTTQKMVEQMKIVQNAYRIESRGGRRMAHMCLSVTEEEFGSLGCNDKLLGEYFSDCVRDIYDMGHQVVYGLHLNQKDEGDDAHAFAHVHMAVNSINFTNGRKFHLTKKEFVNEENVMRQKIEGYQVQSPVIFQNADVYRRVNA